MSEGLQNTADDMRRALDKEELREWVQRQRWYASKARNVAGIDIVESILLREDPLLLLTLVQTRFATGTHELTSCPWPSVAPTPTRSGAASRLRIPTNGPCTTRSPSPARRSS